MPSWKTPAASPLTGRSATRRSSGPCVSGNRCPAAHGAPGPWTRDGPWPKNYEPRTCSRFQPARAYPIWGYAGARASGYSNVERVCAHGGSVSVRAVVAGCLGVVAAASWPLAARAVSATTPTRAPRRASRATLDQYCVGCHNARMKSGGLALDTIDLANVPRDAAVWEQVVRKLNTRTMPPAGARRPDDASYHALASWLESRIDRAAAAAPNPGRPLLHRLNRAEYANAIRDLLALDVDVASLLPPDDSAYGFDNIADVLGVSPSLLERYLSAAEKISALAVGDPSTPAAVTETYRVRQDLSQDQHIDGLPLGTVGGTLVRAHVPARRRVRPAGAVLPDQLRQPPRPRVPAAGRDHGRRRPRQLATIGGAADLRAAFDKPTDDGRRHRRALRGPRAGEGRPAHGRRHLRARTSGSPTRRGCSRSCAARPTRSTGPGRPHVGPRHDHRSVQRHRARRHAEPPEDLRLPAGDARERRRVRDADPHDARRAAPIASR